MILENEVFYAVIIGVLQGITEFLPVSSSGHLIVFSSLWQGHILPLSLNVALHLGTLVAVLLFFHKDIFQMILSLFQRAFAEKKSFHSDVLIPAIIIGTVPAGIIGILYHKDIELIFHRIPVVIFSLAVVGLIMLIVSKKKSINRSLKTLHISDGFIIGLCQASALIPGVSRSGATILGARFLGFTHVDSARFSFLLGIPAMMGAAILQRKEILESIHELSFYIGFFSSMIAGLLTIKFLLKFLNHHGLTGFGFYRLILAAIIGIVYY